MRILTRTVRICVILSMMLTVWIIPVFAEDYTDSDYWSKYCSSAGHAGSDACQGYVQYLQSQSKSQSKELENIKSQREQIAADLQKYDAQLKDLQAQVKSKQAEIDAKQDEIDKKQAEIDAKQVEIDNTQSQIDDLKDKIKKRMVIRQPIMRTSEDVDILMGAQTFEDFIRIANGLNSITQYDRQIQQQLADLIDQLNAQKKELEDDKNVLLVAQAELQNEQNELKDLEAQTQVIIEEQEKQAAALEAEGNRITSNLSKITKTLASIGNVAAAAGWTYPVQGAHRSAGTWAYSSGAPHLGEDFAAPVGSNIYAVANGVVLNSANGCPTYGGLGNTCGTANGGSQGGGNQVYLLVNVNGSLYAVKYLHMMLNTPIAIGTVVTSGTVIGRVGSSGNSSGPHCHVEVFYLGDASNFNAFKNSWNGDLAFGAGWAGSDRKCGSGLGAPCRLRPESLFGS